MTSTSFQSQRGQVAPLLALLAIAIGVGCLGLGRFAAGAVDAARARTAADAAALASAATGERETAEDFAIRNGGVLESFERAGADVRVRVRVGGHHATARARATLADPGRLAGHRPG